MYSLSRSCLFVLPAVFLILLLAACQAPTFEKTIEERPTNTAVPQPIPAATHTRIPFSPTPRRPTPTPRHDLTICTRSEPETLFYHGSGMHVQAAITHAFYETLITNLSYDYQAHGIEKLPSLADGDAVIHEVEVSAGDTVVDTAGNIVTLEAGVVVRDGNGNELTYEGGTMSLPQMTVDFTLKPLVWEDGTPVTAGDSVYSYEVAGDPDTPGTRFTFDRTATYEATGERSVRWTGLPGWLDSTYFLNIWQPLPRHAWSQFTTAELYEANESNRRPLANGPFRIQEWVAGDHISLVRNEHYYRADEGLPLMESLIIRFIPDSNAIMAQLLAEQCDIVTWDSMDVGQVPFLLEAAGNSMLVPYFQTSPTFEHLDFGINSYGDYAESRPDWFEDVRVRQAMTLCTDRQSMIDNLLHGQSEIMHSYIPRSHPLYPDDLSEWPYDVQIGNALLDEVGFLDSDGDGIREYFSANVAGSDPAWDGTPFVVTLGTTAGGDLRQPITQIFAENMLDCGISVERYYPPAGEFFAEGPDGPVFGRKFDLAQFAWLVGTQPGCDLYMTSQIPGPTEEGFTGWGGANATGWSNPEYDAICQTALGSLPGTPEYAAAHQEAQRIFSEQLPVIPLFLRLKVAATRPEICNFHLDPTQPSELWNLYEIGLGDC